MSDTFSPIELRDTLVNLGYLRCDDLGPLRIYSYTDRTVHERAWSDLTLQSRGHIFNRDTGECVAWPFPKFFMVGEPGHEEGALPWDRLDRITEKLDGYLGILYRPPAGGFAIATRGSFRTPAAEWATERIQTHGLRTLPDDVTLCFEIIHPMTHVVVDYEGHEDLVLLAAFNRYTGREYSWQQLRVWAFEYGFNLPEIYSCPLDEITRLLATLGGTRAEGFVARFRGAEGREPPFRVKMKTADYLVRAERKRTARRVCS